MDRTRPEFPSSLPNGECSCKHSTGAGILCLFPGPLTGWWAVRAGHKSRRKVNFLHVRTTPPPRSRVTLYVTVIKGAVHKPEKPNGPVCRCHLYHKATGAFISTVGLLVLGARLPSLALKAFCLDLAATCLHVSSFSLLF